MLRSLVLVLLMLPGAAFAQDAESEPAAEPTEEQPAEPAVDMLTARLQAMVGDYYVAIGSEASEDDLKQGMQSLQMMLLDGVSMSRIEAAVAAAVSLHTPGRRIPFQVAVPLRVRPADAAPRPALADPSSSSSAADPGPTAATEPAAAEPEKTAERTAIEKRWVERQEQLRKRRNRLRLHLQWRDRTKEKRILLSLGIPLFVAGWAGTFSVAGATMTFGETLPSTGWTGAIPIAGPFVFAGLTDAQYPAVFAFAAFQGIGLALTIVALTKKIDWPYDRDPTALYLGRDRRTGKPKVTIHGGPMGVVGEF